MIEVPSAIWRPAHQQKVFRALASVLSRPGRIAEVGAGSRTTRASMAALATLLDGSATLSDLDQLLSERERHCLQAEAAPPGEARYVLADASRAPGPGLQPFRGSPDRPERGATVILVGRGIGRGGTELALRGPGAEHGAKLRVDGFHRDWFTRRAEWIVDYPLGVDFLLTDERRVAGIPRATVLELPPAS